jgi:hypothetical protein
MPNISEAEAHALLSRPLRCEGDFAWRTPAYRRTTRQLSAGILNEGGAATRMYVELIFRYSVKAPVTTYLFTVFKDDDYGPGRVYQLEVTRASRTLKDLHKLSHEHIGDHRSDGKANWNDWEYDEVPAYFCARTNITFSPYPPKPDIKRRRQP